MSAFNLKRRRGKRAIDMLRSLSDDCSSLRPSDMDDATEEEMASLYHSLRGSRTKLAVHGRGDNWTEAPEQGPYDPHPMNQFVPQFGGRWRRNFPGSGDQHINDDQDKQKNLRGQATDDAFDPQSRTRRINDKLDKTRKTRGIGDHFIVRLDVGEGDAMDDVMERAKAMMGDEAKKDGRGIYVETKDFEAAMRIQRGIPGARVERIGR